VKSCDQVEVESVAANAATKSNAQFAAGHSMPPLAAPPRAIRAHGWIGWIPLVVLPLTALTFRDALPAWAFMWLLAAGIFAGFKWQTWWDAPAARYSRNWSRTFAYLLLWPGMDADEFFEPRTGERRIAPSEWLPAIGKTLAGAALIWAAAREIVPSRPMAAGWLAMVGLVLVLHFGTFQLMALAWQRAGIHAEPIMRRPLVSQSLGEFWGKRWNLGFRKLSHALVFRPLQKRFGTAAGTLAAFLGSGLIHDLVISVPARGGYGLPTAYFLLQGFGALAERSRVGRRLGLGRGIRGRLWTAFVALAPVPCLFHPWFVMRVMVPFLRAIGG
jgi:Membrane bound O-acyl transferase family